jgi:hypothetical protein
VCQQASAAGVLYRNVLPSAEVVEVVEAVEVVERAIATTTTTGVFHFFGFC